MKDQNHIPGSPVPKGPRPGYFRSLLMLAGVVLVVAAVLLAVRSRSARPQAAPAGSEAGASASAVNSGATAPATAAAQTGAAAAALNPLADLIRISKDASLPLSERKNAIQALARNGSREALAALRELLGNSPSDVRQAVAEALGQCPSAEGLALLEGLVRDSDEEVAKAAIHGLSSQKQAGAATALAALVTDPDFPAALKCEAALALGSIHEPWVLDPLSRAAKESPDEDVVRAALESISGLDFNTTRGFFEDFLQTPNLSCDVRVSAVEALSRVDGDPTAFLAQLAANDPDAEVRVAAAWAMSATEVTGNAGADILSMLNRESDPDVRLRLYQALLNQQSFDVNTALSLVQNEANPSDRVAGFDALAKALRENPNPSLETFFDSVAIPELKQVAMSGATMDDRQAAVIALMQAGTQEALNALSDVKSQIAKTQNAGGANPAHSILPQQR